MAMQVANEGCGPVQSCAIRGYMTDHLSYSLCAW